MATFNTPGVYVQEVSTLPSSVVAVPTAIPVFIGYTEANTPSTVPVRITSLLDYVALFGGAYSESFTVTLSGADVNISPALNEVTGKDFKLFYHMQMYFANGGGPCYIISVDDFNLAPTLITGIDLQNAIALAEQIDEITMVVIPEAISSNIDDSELKGIYDAMLAHCAKMQDRFSLFDVQMRGISIADDADKFRNLNVGADDLSYGAAYYPSFTPTLSYTYGSGNVGITATDPNLPASVQAFQGQNLNVVNNGDGSTASVEYDFSTLFPIDTGATITINGNIIAIGGIANIGALVTTIANDPNIGGFLSVSNASDVITIAAGNPNYPLTIDVAGQAPAPILGTVVTAIAPDKALYYRILSALAAYPIELLPSATMAGIYGAVDNDRGVWKAPANIGVNLVTSLNANIKDSDQGGLNVDPVGGKSIDAIRKFTGRGTLVWGARTLDGNSNEWRYINVRRLFLMAEDSCKKATEFVVFEPNDKNTWIKVKGMISNFLTNLWRDGALAGDKPEQAFYVRVGLGETMSAQDILEGKMIVQIGMAAVRPAEFIVLQFMHKLQEA